MTLRETVTSSGAGAAGGRNVEAWRWGMRASSFRSFLVPALLALGLEARAQETLAFGQAPTELGLGMRLRLETGAGVRFTGRLASSDASSLTVVDSRGFSLRLQREQIRGIDVGVPRTRTQGALRGAKLGTLIAAALGGTVYAIDRGTRREDGLCGNTEIGITTCTTTADVLMGTFGGALVGAAIGAALPGERWHALRPDKVAFGIGPTRSGGVAIRASLSF
jgi:hypothetical protein